MGRPFGWFRDPFKAQMAHICRCLWRQPYSQQLQQLRYLTGGTSSRCCRPVWNLLALGHLSLFCDAGSPKIVVAVTAVALWKWLCGEADCTTYSYVLTALWLPVSIVSRTVRGQVQLPFAGRQPAVSYKASVVNLPADVWLIQGCQLWHLVFLTLSRLRRWIAIFKSPQRSVSVFRHVMHFIVLSGWCDHSYDWLKHFSGQETRKRNTQQKLCPLSMPPTQFPYENEGFNACYLAVFLEEVHFETDS